MSNPNSSNVSVAKPKVTGGVARGALDAILPTDANTQLDDTITGLGYVAEGGLKLKMDRKSEKQRAWGGAIIHVSQTEFGETYTFTLVESRNAEVLKSVFGEGNITVTVGSQPDGSDSSIVIRHNEQEPPMSVWVFDMKAGKDRRIVIPRGALSDVGDITYADKDLIAYQVSIDALPDESGNSAYEYIAG